jgi:hypothetical protein
MFLFSAAAHNFIRSGLFPTNVCRVTTWPALENVTELCDMTRFLQTLDMCPKGFT